MGAGSHTLSARLYFRAQRNEVQEHQRKLHLGQIRRKIHLLPIQRTIVLLPNPCLVVARDAFVCGYKMEFVKDALVFGEALIPPFIRVNEFQAGARPPVVLHHGERSQELQLTYVVVRSPSFAFQCSYFSA
ncbi:unnamed protein product, partial [Vitis vinifera]